MKKGGVQDATNGSYHSYLRGYLKGSESVQSKPDKIKKERKKAVSSKNIRNK